MRNLTIEYIEKCWRFYQARLEAGLTLIEILGTSGSTPARLSFSSGGAQEQNERLIMEIKSESGRGYSRAITDTRISQIFDSLQNKTLDDAGNRQTHTVERDLFFLGMRFLEAGRLLNREKIRAYIEAGFPANFQDPFSKRTILHRAAAGSSAGFVGFLIDIAKPDLLIRDSKGFLPYDLAYELNTDLNVFNLLLERTYAQAKRQSVPLSNVFTHQESIEERRLLEP